MLVAIGNLDQTLNGHYRQTNSLGHISFFISVDTFKLSFFFCIKINITRYLVKMILVLSECT